jgi:hypothetical protein
VFDSGAWRGWRWVTSVFLVAGGAYWLSAVPLSATPTLEADAASPGLAPLEEAVSRAPANIEALAALAESYLERSAPGLAQAALDRAPDALRGRARIADLRARSLFDLGLVAPALASQERALEACSNRAESCSNAMLARAERRARWLRELARLRVDDNLADPAAASLAYRLATREVRLAVP